MNFVGQVQHLFNASLSCTNVCGGGSFSQQAAVEMLPDDVLLNIFRLYLDSSPRFWPVLTRITRRWRHIVFASPLGLDLQLYCTYGTPVSKILDCWPALPIVVHYGGTVPDPPAPEDDDNIVAALKHSDRVSSIGLTITSSLLKKLSAIEMPFLELEELVLRSMASVQLALPHTLQWGTRLRRLHSTRIAFPVLPVLLSASTGLVDLRLHEIPKVGYFSPEALANALSEMTQLDTLSLHFLSFPSRNRIGLPPQSGERIVLPALTCLKYRGTSKYLDCLVARIDAPCLGGIDITFFFQPTMDASQLGRFMERIETLMPLRQAEIEFSELAISISFVPQEGPTQLELRISCEHLDWQLSSIAQICEQIAPFTFRVEDLRVKEIQQTNGPGQGIDPEKWLKLIRPFRSTKRFYVDDKLLSEILFDLGLANGKHPTVFPFLRILRVLEFEPMLHGSFSTSRLLKRRHVNVYAQERWCNVCKASFTRQQEFKRHFATVHPFLLVCPYCGDFDFTLNHTDLFREHLASKHSEVAHADALISDSTLRNHPPSINFGAFTMFKAPNVPWPESVTEVETRLDTVVHFLPSPYPT